MWHLSHWGWPPPPPHFGKSVTNFFYFFLASRPCDWNFLSKEFFSKMLGKFFNLGTNFSQNFGPTDQKLGADPPPTHLKKFFDKKCSIWPEMDFDTILLWKRMWRTKGPFRQLCLMAQHWSQNLHFVNKKRVNPRCRPKSHLGQLCQMAEHRFQDIHFTLRCFVGRAIRTFGKMLPDGSHPAPVPLGTNAWWLKICLKSSIS